MGKLDTISWKMVACIKVISHVSIAFKNGVGMDGFQCCLSEISRANLVSILICRVISAKSMWCGGHVWHLAVRVGELVWLQIMPFVCRFVDWSEVADPALWSNDWLEPPRQKSLPHDSAWVLVDIHCLCIFGWPASRVEIQFFIGARWNKKINYQVMMLGIFIFEDQSCSPCFVGFSPICLGKFEKTDLEGRDLPLIFGQSLVGHSLYCQNHDSPNVQTWCEEMSPQILRVSECLSLALHWKLLLELVPEHGQLFL